MSLALLSVDGLMFVLRWLHIFFGVTWIGLLYYFNFVQGPYFAEIDAASKSAAIQKLVPRALWWFRWMAMFTMLTGIIMYGVLGAQMGEIFMLSSRGVMISAGVVFAMIMWANVWFVIWPNQKIVIQSATQAASGGAALPEAAACGARAGLASRHNVLFSIPMLFLMAASTHLPLQVNPEGQRAVFWVIFFVLAIGLEINALKGKLGVLTTIKGVITSGFALTALIYIAAEIFLK